MNDVILMDPAPEAEQLAAAMRAIVYLLDRVQRDPDLGWHVLGTEAFALLCQAESAYTGEPVEHVRKRRSLDMQPRHRRRSARLPLALKHLEAIVAAARKALDLLEALGWDRKPGRRGSDFQDLHDAVEAAEKEGFA